ncbi:MAG TPA: hypothetical protein VJS92_14170, partial [Candidatus Polarisedimenticolaceae bacterium]|nr:hypothetical protein [Candidatus Polarisedimenticolaceae bacterium]
MSVRVVVRFRTGPLGPFVFGSTLGHIGLAAGLILVPALRRTRVLPDDAVRVELVAVAPARPAV